MEVFMQAGLWFMVFVLAAGGVQDSTPKLDEAKALIAELKLDEARKAFEAAKGGMAEDAVKEIEANLAALEAFLKVKADVEEGLITKALNGAAEVLKAPCDLIFAEKAVKLYEELKDMIFYVINDFEPEGKRDGKWYKSSEGASAEIVKGTDVAADGRYALKIRFEAAPAGTVRSVTLVPPGDFGEALILLKGLTMHVHSEKEQAATFDIVVPGLPGKTRAEYLGATLKHTGWKKVHFTREQFIRRAAFVWPDGREVILQTKEAGAMEFLIDDVKFVR
jgi:hypothetical protein